MDCVPFLNHIELYSINRKRRSNTMKNKENESYKIELCSEYIKSNNLGIKKQFKKHIVETGNKKFDEIGFLEIDVLYLPNLEFALIEYDINLQREALEFLNELALKKQISIVATLMPIIQPYQNGVFYFVNKIDEKSLETITSLTMGSKHNVVCTDNKTVIIKCQDYWNKSLDLAETVMMQSSDEFYTFDSITCYTDF